MDCKYCRIVENQYPAHILYKDQSVVAFLVENPVSKGHCLVVPREHVERYTEIKDVAGFATGLQRFLGLMEKKVCHNMHLVVTPARKTGPEITHFHIHVIPQYEGEKIFEWTWHQLTDEEVKEMFTKIKG